eukprot:TRINITY_DN2126_c0_g2_i1.p1 TRINITY_DN2126_c0_g2~~TRINITY_DN2126_c0_g2_i1.p1  ORF type:complete len:196 (-),score=31.21 TRINITY_DN2126_c0_g2_i1:344-931(-)
MSSYKKSLIRAQATRRSKSPPVFTNSSSPDYRPANSYAAICKSRPMQSVFKIHNPFSKRTTQLNLKQSPSPVTRNYPKTYSATLPSNEKESVDETRDTLKRALESRLKKFQREINPKGVEIPHNENSSMSDSSLDSILLQMKFDRRNSKSIEKLTDINMSLAKELQAMKQQMEYIRLSQDLSNTLHSKRELQVLL